MFCSIYSGKRQLVQLFLVPEQVKQEELQALILLKKQILSQTLEELKNPVEQLTAQYVPCKTNPEGHVVQLVLFP